MEFLLIGKQIKSFVDGLVGSWKSIIDAKDFADARRQHKNVVSVVSKMKYRMYGRYSIIYAMEYFLNHPDETRQQKLRQNFRSRVEYLRDFNEEVTPRLYEISPKTAADMGMITIKSIEVYKALERADDEDFRDCVSEAMPVMLDVAIYLDNALTSISDSLGGDPRGGAGYIYGRDS